MERTLNIYINGAPCKMIWKMRLMMFGFQNEEKEKNWVEAKAHCWENMNNY